MLFDWLRRKTRDAVLGGVHDAVDVIANGTPEAPDPLLALRDRLALPAPEPQQESPVRRKATARR